MHYRYALFLVSAVALSACVSKPPPSGNTLPSAAQGVYFIEPVDGSTVSSPVKVKFGLKGMTVKPAGELAEGTGHHHLLIGDFHIDGFSIPHHVLINTVIDHLLHQHIDTIIFG